MNIGCYFDKINIITERKSGERMKKVLIVDDEYRIGLLIKALIHWNELEMENVDVLDNSERALQVILTDSPDVVITDMRMPKVDGLELIRRTREAGLDTKFVVVSGYREFDYAQQAIGYGVEDYILKPVQEDELNKALLRVKEKLDTESKTINLYKNYMENRENLRKNLLDRILNKEEVTESESSILNFEGAFYRGIDIKLDYLEYQVKNKQEDELMLKKVRGLLEDFLSNQVKEFLLCDKKGLHIFCMINYDETQRESMNNLFSNMIGKIKEQLIGFERYAVTIGIGAEKKNLSDMSTSITEAYHAVCNRISLGTGRVIDFTELVCTKENDFSSGIEQQFSELKKSIETCSKEELEKVIEQITYLDGYLSEYDFTYIYKGAEKLIEIFFQLCPEKDPLLQERKEEIIEKISHCYRIRDLVNTLKRSFSEILDLIILNKENESVLPVRLAREYIELHYGEKIPLEMIAEVVNLNPVYFSTLFKKETGMTFTAYLANERMEKAKTLLVNTNDTIEAIGYAVGYSDYKYFCQQFKKIVGVKPNVYRKLYS